MVLLGSLSPSQDRILVEVGKQKILNEDDYDPHLHRPVSHPTTYERKTFLLFTSVLVLQELGKFHPPLKSCRWNWDTCDAGSIQEFRYLVRNICNFFMWFNSYVLFTYVGMIYVNQWNGHLKKIISVS